jgi:hypothetical protein
MTEVLDTDRAAARAAFAEDIASARAEADAAVQRIRLDADRRIGERAAASDAASSIQRDGAEKLANAAREVESRAGSVLCRLSDQADKLIDVAGRVAVIEARLSAEVDSAAAARIRSVSAREDACARREQGFAAAAADAERSRTRLEAAEQAVVAVQRKADEQFAELRTVLESEQRRLTSLQKSLSAQSEALAASLLVERQHIAAERAAMLREREASLTSIAEARQQAAKEASEAAHAADLAARSRATADAEFSNERETLAQKRAQLAADRQALAAEQAALRAREAEIDDVRTAIAADQTDADRRRRAIERRESEVAAREASVRAESVRAEQALADASRELRGLEADRSKLQAAARGLQRERERLDEARAEHARRIREASEARASETTRELLARPSHRSGSRHVRHEPAAAVNASAVDGSESEWDSDHDDSHRLLANLGLNSTPLRLSGSRQPAPMSPDRPLPKRSSKRNQELYDRRLSPARPAPRTGHASDMTATEALASVRRHAATSRSTGYRAGHDLVSALSSATAALSRGSARLVGQQSFLNSFHGPEPNLDSTLGGLSPMTALYSTLATPMVPHSATRPYAASTPAARPADQRDEAPSAIATTDGGDVASTVSGPMVGPRGPVSSLGSFGDIQVESPDV